MKNSLKENMARFGTKNLAEQSTAADIQNAWKIHLKDAWTLFVDKKKPGQIDYIDNKLILFINGKIFELIP